MTAAEKAVVNAAKAFVAHERSESSSNWDGPGSNWIEELKTSNSLDIPVEFMELVYAVEALAPGLATCSHCHRLFEKQTKRKRKYCSIRCKSADSQKQWRKRDKARRKNLKTAFVPAAILEKALLEEGRNRE